MERGAHLQYIVKVSDLNAFEFWFGLMICKCPDNIWKIAVNFALKMLKLENWLNPTWFQWKYGKLLIIRRTESSCIVLSWLTEDRALPFHQWTLFCPRSHQAIGNLKAKLSDILYFYQCWNIICTISPAGNLCPPWDVRGGVKNTTSVYFDTVLSVECGTGFKLAENVTQQDMISTCLANSTWTNHIPDCDCKFWNIVCYLIEDPEICCPIVLLFSASAKDTFPAQHTYFWPMQNYLVCLVILKTKFQTTVIIRWGVIAQWSSFHFTYHTSYFPMSQPTAAKENLCALDA